MTGKKNYSMFTASRYTSATIAKKKEIGIYQNKKPLTRSTTSATKSALLFLFDRSTFQSPRENRLTARIPSTAATLKKRTGKIDPPIGLSSEMVGTMFNIGPNRKRRP
ncbi:MAG TPA: hypothetical protein VNW25_02215 [Candidatus Sulfotelmatobacter sp.]|nr:hypothetical protein [Candidatus Sulfotelmatobacter sp.]